MGIGSYSSETKLTFKQNQFFPGESIKIYIENDNSKNKFAIKNFKFKLFRIITTKDPLTGELKTVTDKLFAFKEPGVEAHGKTKRDFEFKIPMTYPDSKKKDVPLQSSWMGDVFAVGYIFNVYVKVQSMTDFGEGDKTSLPVRIFATPELIQSQEPYCIPTEWNPYQDNFGICYLYNEENACS